MSHLTPFEKIRAMMTEGGLTKEEAWELLYEMGEIDLDWSEVKEVRLI